MKQELESIVNGLQNVKLELDGAMAIVTMARPKAMNALNNQTLGELDALFDYFRKDKEILGVIITGEGKAFVAGADISQMNGYNAEQGRDYADYAQSVFNKIEALEKPVIAAVNGYAKVTINEGINMDLRRGLEFEKDVCALTFGSEDSKEGMSAFLGKRPAEFKNC